MTSQILAATMTILFEGLMVFGGQKANTKTHVVIENDTDHSNPTLYINLKRVEGLRKGDEITFTKTNGDPFLPGPANTTATFDARIPTLPTFIKKGGSIHSDVKNATHPHNYILAFVTLPKGDLTAEGKFDHPAKFTLTDGSEQVLCAAPQVRLTITHSETKVILKIANSDTTVRPKTLTFELGPSDIVGFENTSSVAGNHFHKYEHLLDVGSALGSVSEVKNQGCDVNGNIIKLAVARKDLSTPTISSDLSAADLFSIFRTFSPSGDCGPVDFP